jgi:hypothetical protein
MHKMMKLNSHHGSSSNQAQVGFLHVQILLQMEMCLTVGIMKVSPFLSKNQTLLLLCLPASSLRMSACQLSCLTDIPRTNNKAAKNGEQKPLQ